MRTLRRVQAWGRKVAGWLAVAAFVAAFFVIIAGLTKPSALEFAEGVLCPRAGQEIRPGGGDELRIMRKSADSDYAVFCTGESSGVQDVTGRWFMLWGALAVTGGLALLVRARVTPPTMRAPTVPAGR